MYKEQTFTNTILKQWFHKLLTSFPYDTTYGTIKTIQILIQRSPVYNIHEL